ALDDDVRTRLMSLTDEMHLAADGRELATFRELDFTFHRTVIEVSGNIYLPRMWDIIEPSLRSMHVLGDPMFEGDWHQVADWHRGLLEVLDAGDPDAAAELFRSHAAGTLLEPEDNA